LQSSRVSSWIHCPAISSVICRRMDASYAAAPRVTLRGAGSASPWNLTMAASPQAVGTSAQLSPSQGEVRTGLHRQGAAAFTPVRAVPQGSAGTGHGIRMTGDQLTTNRERFSQALTPPSAGSAEGDSVSQGFSSPSSQPGVFRHRQATPSAPLSFSPAPRSLATAVRAMTAGSWAPAPASGQLTSSAGGAEVAVPVSSSLQRPILSNRSRPMNVMRHVSSPAGPVSPESASRSPGPAQPLRRSQAEGAVEATPATGSSKRKPWDSRPTAPIGEAAKEELAESDEPNRPWPLTSHNKQAAKDVLSSGVNASPSLKPPSQERILTAPNGPGSEAKSPEATREQSAKPGPLRPHLYQNYPTKGLYA